MNTDYNSQAFPSLVDALEFIKVLLRQDEEFEEFKNDIHIYTEEDFVYVEWIQKSKMEEFDYGAFRFVDSNQAVLTEFIFPDNHTEFLETEEEYKERLDEFLEEDPDWARNTFGNWYRPSEQKTWEEYMNKTKQDKE